MSISDKTTHFSKVHHFKIPKRTEGDGMEKEELSKLDSSKIEEKVPLRDQLIYRPVDLRECSVPPTPITGKVVNLVPKLVNRKNPSSFNVKFAKEPKFVPYEPYKAATNPIVGNKTVKKKVIKLVNDTNSNVEDLMNLKKVHISEITPSQCLPASNSAEKSKEQADWEEEKKALLEELNKLKADNSDLENQVKFQTQVNGEVKKLLVAAVGEDIETRVQLLTEDKLHLAKQLLKTAKTLSTHQEQIEWLAGQCEVWRSKFLASSILVEDLARWKAGLYQKVTEYQNALQNLMKDKDIIRRDVFDTFVNLSILQEKFNLDVVPQESNQRQLISSNIVELCASNHHLSDLLMAQLLHDDMPQKKTLFELNPVDCQTSAEKAAEQALMQPVISIEHTDVACSAVMTGAALALSSAAPHCSHCNGVVKTI